MHRVLVTAEFLLFHLGGGRGVRVPGRRESCMGGISVPGKEGGPGGLQGAGGGRSRGASGYLGKEGGPGHQGARGRREVPGGSGRGAELEGAGPAGTHKQGWDPGAAQGGAVQGHGPPCPACSGAARFLLQPRALCTPLRLQLGQGAPQLPRCSRSCRRPVLHLLGRVQGRSLSLLPRPAAPTAKASKPLTLGPQGGIREPHHAGGDEASCSANRRDEAAIRRPTVGNDPWDLSLCT